MTCGGLKNILCSVAEEIPGEIDAASSLFCVQRTQVESIASVEGMSWWEFLHKKHTLRAQSSKQCAGKLTRLIGLQEENGMHSTASYRRSCRKVIQEQHRNPNTKFSASMKLLLRSKIEATSDALINRGLAWIMSKIPTGMLTYLGLGPCLGPEPNNCPLGFTEKFTSVYIYI